jgi:hypothetical protein
MNRKPVSSSMLASIGYDEKEKILELEFDHGGIYQYFDVPKEEYEEMMDASSHGGYFLDNIEDCYEWLKIR